VRFEGVFQAFNPGGNILY